MKGYKGMDKDMRCRGFQFEVGGTYKVAEGVEVCRNGFHFCKNLVDVFKFYEKNGANRFFEVEASGVLQVDFGKIAAEKIKVIRELGEVEVNRAVYGYGDGYGKHVNIQRILVFNLKEKK